MHAAVGAHRHLHGRGALDEQPTLQTSGEPLLAARHEHDLEWIRPLALQGPAYNAALPGDQVFGVKGCAYGVLIGLQGRNTADQAIDEYGQYLVAGLPAVVIAAYVA